MPVSSGPTAGLASHPPCVAICDASTRFAVKLIATRDGPRTTFLQSPIPDVIPEIGLSLHESLWFNNEL